ncbi:hypothetical protein SAMN05660865_01492 [Caloramator fervidus]|uniref:Transposase n=1 Tax=Caloramator fervidus TaxID=29344 RepID=A0A1H5WJT0_9CLOT|nr:hypothetical protein [Caloramator fervidus]SEF99546.1 hypothetical protein SAMN05660865_01492 [Caloramator fervidus]
MLKYNFINNLFNLKDVSIKNIVNSDDRIEIYTETKKKPHICPKYESITSKVHNYRTRQIKDTPIQGKKLSLSLKNVDMFVNLAVNLSLKI